MKNSKIERIYLNCVFKTNKQKGFTMNKKLVEITEKHSQFFGMTPEEYLETLTVKSEEHDLLKLTLMMGVARGFFDKYIDGKNHLKMLNEQRLELIYGEVKEIKEEVDHGKIHDLKLEIVDVFLVAIGVEMFRIIAVVENVTRRKMILETFSFQEQIDILKEEANYFNEIGRVQSLEDVECSISAFKYGYKMLSDEFAPLIKEKILYNLKERQEFFIK